MKASNDVNLSKTRDVGFAEADILVSIEEAARGHIKWIYDCLLARAGSDVAFRISPSAKEEMWVRSIEIYAEYIKAALQNSKKSFG